MSDSDQKQPIYLADYQVPDFIIDTVHLHFDIETDYTEVHSVLNMKRNPEGNLQAPLVLDGEDMELRTVSLDGRVLEDNEYQVGDKTLQLTPGDNPFKFSCVVRIKPLQNTTLMGLYASNANLCTQCEPHGFRRITYFIDRPDVLSLFTTTISADKSQYPHLLSNGNLIETRELPNDRHWVHWEDPSLKPCYLYALVAGDFDVLEDEFVTCSGRNVQLRFYLETGYGDQGRFALESLKRSMKWDEQTYGREYELNIYMVVAVSDFNFGAMENKGLNVFNTSCVLVDQERATDDDCIRVEDVIGHEYFHNWSGNRVTCRDWFQLTLKEGLTVFRDQCFSEDMTGSELIRLQEAQLVRTAQFAEDASPLAHPIRPPSYIEMNNFYTHTVYRKGAEVIRMLHTFMGAAKFRQAMDLYFERHDGQAVTTDDFLAVMGETDDSLDLVAFQRWYDVAGTPVITVSDNYDAAAQTYTLTVAQSLRCGLYPRERAVEKPFYFPLAMGLVAADGAVIESRLDGEDEPVVGTRILTVQEQEQSFVFVGVESAPIPSLLRRFSAPVDLCFEYADEDLFVLWQHDVDAFVRDQARQDVLTRVILQLAAAVGRGEELSLPVRLIEVVRHLLSCSMNDFNIQAQLLMLPAAAYILQRAAGMDLDHVGQAYLFVRQQLAKELHKEWLTCYERFPLGDFRQDVVAMGERRLRGVCLQAMCGAGDEDSLGCAFEQYEAADNMTDTMAALVALNDHGSHHRDNAMAEFLARWEDEPLVLCKWLGLQATQRHPQVCERVQVLMDSDLFDWQRPNIVSALLGAFTRNWWGFHSADGGGYRLVQAAVERLDSINPQVAARLVRPLTEWQSLDAARAQLMRDALQAIAQLPGVSGDVYEIATKGVAQ